MSDETTTTRRRKSGTIEDAKVDTTADLSNQVPDWAEGFDNEDYPDAIMVDEGEKLFFTVLESNFIPIPSKFQKEPVPTEVVQVLINEGTTVTEKGTKEDNFASTGVLVTPGEIRSLWLNCQMLKDIWAAWEVENEDVGALVFKGHVEPRSGGTPYQKWIGKFNKTKPRKVQSAAR